MSGDSAFNIPHADWCQHCIAGRERADALKSGNNEERTNGVVQFDYCFASDEMVLVENEEQAKVKILVAKGMDSGYPFATVVRKKGSTDMYAVEVMARWIDQLGLTDAYFQSDGESAIKDLVRAVARRCSTLRVRFRVAPNGSPSSNGGAEGTVKLIMSTVRVFISALKEQCGMQISPGHPLLVWMIRHAAWCEARYRASGAHKQSPYFRIHGRNYANPVCMIGEIVMARIPDPKEVGKLQPRFLRGVFLGKSDTSDSYIVPCSDGVVRVTRVIRRKPAGSEFCAKDVPETPPRRLSTYDSADNTYLVTVFH